MICTNDCNKRTRTHTHTHTEMDWTVGINDGTDLPKK